MRRHDAVHGLTLCVIWPRWSFDDDYCRGNATECGDSEIHTMRIFVICEVS